NAAQWIEIKNSFLAARVWFIIPAFITLLLSHYSRALRWKLLMEPLGYKPGNFNTFAAVMIGYFVNAGVPRLGEVVKCSLLAKYENVRADKLIGTMVMERAVDVICLLLVFLAALVFQGDIIGDYVVTLFGNFFRDKAGSTSISKILLSIGIVLLFLLVIHFILKKFGHIDAIGKIKGVLKGIAVGLWSIRFLKKKWLFIFHTVFIWGMYYLSTTIGIFALRETAHLGFAAGITTLAIGSIGIILTPGGIGAYPLLVSKLVGLYGLDENTIGTALGWLLWFVQTIIVIATGLILLLLFSYKNKNKSPLESRSKLTPEDIEQI
ncbi:MAG TPA: lysylphosphatidylglycerol synthase transmembrane domain-containing protein, partial [Flavisolibacter sp.]|nr:lysylphosphatidylglycerol synthase transmembrane domain-containing protein [Flavisolibacter sp.]